MIKSKIRNEFSANSSGKRYYDSKGEAINAFNATLNRYGYQLDCVGCNWHHDEGRAVVSVLADEDGPVDSNGDPAEVALAHFTWHRMESGRWEVIGYLT